MKTIQISKSSIRNLVLSILFGTLLFFTLEHFGHYSYIANPEIPYDNKPSFRNYIDGKTKVSTIFYKTFFGTTIQSGGNGFEAFDMHFKDGNFYTYRNKLYFVTEAMKEDFKYALIFILSFFLIFSFFSNFKIKLK